MQKGKLIRVDGVWMHELPNDAAFALGYKEGLEVDISLTNLGLNVVSTAPNRDAMVAAAHEFTENRGAFKKLSKE